MLCCTAYRHIGKVAVWHLSNTKENLSGFNSCSNAKKCIRHEIKTIKNNTQDIQCHYSHKGNGEISDLIEGRGKQKWLKLTYTEY